MITVVCYEKLVFFVLPIIIFIHIFQIIRPVNIFLVIDVQNDFISGSLNISNCSAQQNGMEVKNLKKKKLITY